MLKLTASGRCSGSRYRSVSNYDGAAVGKAAERGSGEKHLDGQMSATTEHSTRGDKEEIGDERVRLIIRGKESVHLVAEAFGAEGVMSPLGQAEGVAVMETPLQGAPLTKYAVEGLQEQPNGDATYEECPSSRMEEGEAYGPVS